MIIYATLKNDSGDGRGPMVMDKIFKTRKEAEEYIDKQPGVMGRRFKWSEIDFGDWKIQEFEVDDSKSFEDVEKEMNAVRDFIKKFTY